MPQLALDNLNIPENAAARDGPPYGFSLFRNL